MSPPLLELRDLGKTFARARTLPEILLRRAPVRLRAVRGISLTLARGETLSLVGESGSGKTTLGRCVAGFHAASEGSILIDGAPPGDRRVMARRVQMIFQDPYSSLNPRMPIGRALRDVLSVLGRREVPVEELLALVGLPASVASALPHALSGGQRQRVSIARALAAEPDLIVADEPVSALDASVQAKILNLFTELRGRLGLAYLFIAHDLGVVHHISDRVAVMYLGEIVETAPTEALFAAPRHPYTRALLSAIPLPDPTRRNSGAALTGELPDPLRPPPGCAFATRCPMVVPACLVVMPAAREVGRSVVRCIRAEEVSP